MTKWQLRNTNKKASVDLWDSMSRGFEEYRLPTFEDNRFLKLLADNEMFREDSLVLDVGCGTGKYANAIAPACKRVTGIDLSPAMLEIAERKSREYSAGNVNYMLDDWHELDLKEKGLYKEFDLVFAHMTPAVQSSDSFKKLAQASKGWCVLSKPTRRTDPVSDAVKALAGIREKRESSDDDIVYAFELLWRQGVNPCFAYEQQHWHLEKTLEQAYALYINRVKTYRDLSPDEEANLEEYLQSIAENGLITEDIETTITTIYWHV